MVLLFGFSDHLKLGLISGREPAFWRLQGTPRQRGELNSASRNMTDNQLATQDEGETSSSQSRMVRWTRRQTSIRESVGFSFSKYEGLTDAQGTLKPTRFHPKESQKETEGMKTSVNSGAVSRQNKHIPAPAKLIFASGPYLHRRQRTLCGLCGPGIDEVSNPLRLGEIEAPVQEGPQSELTCTRDGGTRLQTQGLQHERLLHGRCFQHGSRTTVS